MKLFIKAFVLFTLFLNGSVTAVELALTMPARDTKLTDAATLAQSTNWQKSPLGILLCDRKSYLGYLVPDLKEILYYYTKLQPLIDMYEKCYQPLSELGAELENLGRSEKIIALLEDRSIEIITEHLLLSAHPESYDAEVRAVSSLLDKDEQLIKDYAARYALYLTGRSLDARSPDTISTIIQSAERTVHSTLFTSQSFPEIARTISRLLLIAGIVPEGDRATALELSNAPVRSRCLATAADSSLNPKAIDDSFVLFSGTPTDDSQKKICFINADSFPHEFATNFLNFNSCKAKFITASRAHQPPPPTPVPTLPRRISQHSSLFSAAQPALTAFCVAIITVAIKINKARYALRRIQRILASVPRAADISLLRKSLATQPVQGSRDEILMIQGRIIRQFCEQFQLQTLATDLHTIATFGTRDIKKEFIKTYQAHADFFSGLEQLYTILHLVSLINYQMTKSPDFCSIKDTVGSLLSHVHYLRKSEELVTTSALMGS